MALVSSPERYHILDRIGAGGLGVVYKVEDRVTGKILAMKVMPRDRGVANLRSEFLALARLRHDNIVSVSDYGLTESGDDFFTMEHVEGPPLLEAVDQVPSDGFFQLIGGVLRALAFIHGRGMVHADLKPSNILIDGKVLARDPARAARLVDFGLAAHLDDPESSSARGTFLYAAPEVYAGRLDARSDLYSFGVIVYEMLTGAQPYTGQNVREVLAAQRRAPPADPRELRPDLPEALAELACALLDPAPGARPQTADEVLTTINEIAGTDFAIIGTQPLVDLGGVLVGRERDLATLERYWREARDAQGSALLLSGEEGIGKSRLMAELKLSVQLHGGLAFSADVASRSETPYAGIAKLVRGLLASAGASAGDMNEWRRTLAPLLGGRVEVAQTDRASRFALAEAVTGVVLQLALTRPLLLLVDDIHQANPATIELLSYLVRSVPDSSVLMVLAARQHSPADSDETAETAADVRVAQILTALANAERGQCIDLPALDRAAVFRLAEMAFGAPIAKRIGDELYRVSGGNPAHATRAMEMLVHNGTIGRERGAWILKADVPVIPMPADVRVSALNRISQLPPRTRRILHTASVLGESFTRDVLGELMLGEEDAEAGLGVETGADPALAEAVRARLVSADATTGSFHFVHRRVSNLLYRELGETDRMALHRRAAAILEEHARQGKNVPPGALAHHYLAIGAREQAVTWGLKAAEDHSQSYDHHGALTWYHRLRHIVSGVIAVQVDTRIGDLYAILGKIDEACTSYHRAHRDSAGDPERHIRLARKLGDLLRRRGDSDAAMELLENALREAQEHQLVTDEAECHLSLGWVLVYRAEYAAAMEQAMSGMLIARALRDRRLLAELGRLRSSIVTSQGDTQTALVYLEAALEDAESTGDDALSAGVLLELGRAAIHNGDYARAIDALEKAIASTERIGHIELAARCYNNLGVACYYQGDWERARTSCEQFRRLCDRFDEQTELVNALNNLGSLYRELGQFNEALAALERASQLAATTRHARMAAMIEGNRGEVLYRRGDLAGARECYEHALSEFQRIGAREDIIENRRRLCELDIATGKLDRALDRAIDTAREAKDAGARLEEGILHRVAANALRLQGDYESAVWFIERAREILTTLGARYERAKVDLAAAELAAAQGENDDAERHFDAAIDAFASLGARWDLSVARARKRSILPQQPTPTTLTSSTQTANSQVGLDLFLDFTQALANVEIERLLEIALDKILAITSFERSFILLLDHDGRPLERLRRVRPGAKGFARDEAEFSGTIVRRVASTGEAVAVGDIDQEHELREQKSVVALGLRQIMCAPMRAHGRVIGIIYIDSRRLSFEEHGVDIVLLESFAAQIALAVENSRLIAEERRKSELMAILAHEIRNPLAGLLGYADIGEAGETEEVGLHPREIFRRIRLDAERLRRLVDNVLELARHERGNVEWSMRPFDMAALIAEVIESNRPVCEHKRVIMRTMTQDLHDTALGNADRVMQVLVNLLNNALKFTPSQGTVTITARSETVAATDPEAPPIPTSEIQAWLPTEPTEEMVQQFVRVDVSDTGPGMTEELRARLFEKFAQGSGRRRSAGVGLGLYISREIIMRHAGTIWVESELGKGSTFSFRIPVAR
jgi:signal transduction histidine kinase/predicted ATPase